MTKIAAIVLAVVALPSAALAQAKAAPTPAPAPSGFCKQAVDRIDDVQKDLAQLHADEIGDDSAPRASMRAAQTTAKFAEAQTLLMQMGQAHCAPYQETIGWVRYVVEATSCRAAMVSFKSGDSLDACRKTTWGKKSGAISDGGLKSMPNIDVSGAK